MRLETLPLYLSFWDMLCPGWQPHSTLNLGLGHVEVLCLSGSVSFTSGYLLSYEKEQYLLFRSGLSLLPSQVGSQHPHYSIACFWKAHSKMDYRSMNYFVNFEMQENILNLVNTKLECPDLLALDQCQTHYSSLSLLYQLNTMCIKF